MSGMPFLGTNDPHATGSPNGSFKKSHNLGQNRANLYTHTSHALEDMSALVDELLLQEDSTRQTATPEGERAFTPKHVLLDKKVLSFDAYFIEDVHYSPLETYRVRKVQINYFLQDQTFIVIERKSLTNSGLPTGVLIKRQRMKKGDPEGRDFYGVTDLNIGKQLTFWGKTFRLVNCDLFTRNYLGEHGVSVPEPEDYPRDEFEEHRRRIDLPRPLSEKRPGERAQLKKFLENDRKVLRFYAVWEDSDSVRREQRHFVLHYFLVDDTVEVRETVDGKTGRYSFPVFVRRQKLPVEYHDLNDLASGDNVSETHLRIGGFLRVFGRNFYLYDCDVFTRRYYSDKYDIDWDELGLEASGDSGGAESLMNSMSDSHGKPNRVIPDYIGFGSPLDSLASVDALIPKPPKKDFRKLMANDKKVLRFSARLDTDRPDQKSRRFVLSYYLADDTIGVFEPPERNSGIVGGKFLERRRMEDALGRAMYSVADFFVGAVIELYNHRFILSDADEYALKFMESNADMFPMSNIDMIENRVRDSVQQSAALREQLRGSFQKFDSPGTGFITLEEFRHVIISLGFSLTEQQIITLMRRYDIDNDNRIYYREFLQAMGCVTPRR